MPIEAAPIVVDPSGEFLGDDGPWSTFLVNVGNPPQQLHVLVASQVASTWVVSPDGCGTNDSSNCTKARGGPFDDGKSTSWSLKSLYQLDAESNLGYTGNAINGTYGFDTIGLPGAPGVATVSADHQVVASVSTDAFFLGSIGVNAATINFTSADDTAPSFLTSLKNQSLIPSRSFGYTAGASYRQGGVNGSLTLGGYDASRLIPNDVPFTFAPTQNRQLIASLQSIQYSDSKTQTSLLSSGIMVLLDTTVPYIWLPQNACQAFEKAFGISWDPISNLYLVNNTHHQQLLKTNASVSFELSNSLSGPAVNITLPYASFDLEAVPPLVSNSSRYFPLQRANDESSFTLGRAFFQEAFLFVDFDNSNFTISQATFDPKTPSHIVAVQSSNSTSTAPSNPISTGVTKTTGNSSSGISAGAIAGIVVVVVLLAIGALVGFWFYRRRKNKNQQRIDSPAEGPLPEKPIVVDDSKDDEPMEGPSSDSKEATGMGVSTAEVPQSPPPSEIGGDEFYPPGSPRKPLELPGHIPGRSELSTPEQAPELGGVHDVRSLRSELSTPEPKYNNTELPSGEGRHEMPSPNPSDTDAIISSSDSEGGSPLPMQRPLSGRMDSGISEFGPDGLGLASINHQVEDPPVSPRVTRKDSSESGVSSGLVSPVSPPLSPTRKPIPQQVAAMRPKYQHRLNSNDSESISTRMGMKSAESRTAHAKEQSSTVTDPKTATETEMSDGPEETEVLSEKAEGKKPAH